MKVYLLSLISLLFFAATSVKAACSPGEKEVTVTIKTDDYGSETSWTLKDANTNATYGSGSGYGDNGTYNIPVCVPENANLKFTITDSYGDGIYGPGGYFINVDGYVVAEGNSFGSQDIVYFPAILPTFDASVILGVNSKLAIGKHFMEGSVKNEGITPITSFVLNWAVDNGEVRSQEFTGVNIQPFKTFEWTHNYGWNAETEGSFSIKTWISEVNGSSDENAANDESVRSVQVFKKERNTLVEVITSANCGPCAATVPYLMNRVKSAESYAIAIAWHGGPGAYSDDPFYQDNKTIYNARDSYYSASGFPTSALDGIMTNNYDYPTYINSNVINSRALVATDFSIDDVTFSVNDADKTASFSAKITTSNSSANYSNYKVHAVVVEKYVKFKTPPGTNGEVEFRYSAKAMYPGTSGTALTTILNGGASGTLSGTWNFSGKNIYNPESLAVVFFVQDNTNKRVHQAAMADLRGEPNVLAPSEEEWPSNIVEIGSGLGISIYPNPANDQLNLKVQLEKSGKAEVSMHNTLGQTVKSINWGDLKAGENQLQLNTANLPSGIYLLNVQIGDRRVTERVLISE